MSTIKTKDGTEIYFNDWGTGQPALHCRWTAVWPPDKVFATFLRELAMLHPGGGSLRCQ